MTLPLFSSLAESPHREDSLVAECETDLSACVTDLAKTGLFTFGVEIPSGATRLEQCTALLAACTSARKQEHIVWIAQEESCS